MIPNQPRSVYHITVKCVGVSSGQVIGMKVDGAECPDARIVLVDDRREHFVEEELGYIPVG